jgi:hypothetical protein
MVSKHATAMTSVVRRHISISTYLIRQKKKGLLKKAKGWESPLIDVTPVPKDKELRISVVTKNRRQPAFFSNVSDVINSHGLFSKRKYIEHFANGRTVYTFYLDEIKSQGYWSVWLLPLSTSIIKTLQVPGVIEGHGDDV